MKTEVLGHRLLVLIVPFFALALGLTAAVRPTEAFGGLLALVIAVLLTSADLRHFGWITLAVTSLIPAVLLVGHYRGGAIAKLPISGQARVVVLLSVLAGAKLVAQRCRVRVPGYVVMAVVAYVLSLLVSVATAYIDHHEYAGITTDLSRQATYPLALFIGASIGASASSVHRRLDVYRGLALVAIAAAGASCLYWLWSTKGVSAPFVSRIFGYTAQTSTYGTGRSIFPFVNDSPNLCAVAFAGMVAFLAPPLLLAGERRNRRLASGLIVASSAAILTTESRTGLIALAAALVTFVLFMPAGRSRRKLVLGLLVVAVAITVAYSSFPKGRDFSAHAQSFVSRQEIWREAGSRFLASPIFGQGYHFSAQPNFVEYVSAPAYGAPNWRLNSVHDEYLGQLVDGGIVGGLIFVALVAALVRLGRQLTRSERSRAEGIGMLCLLATLGVSAVASAETQSAVVVTLLWLFSGFAASALQSKGRP
jgi:O-antigen ligase